MRKAIIRGVLFVVGVGGCLHAQDRGSISTPASREKVVAGLARLLAEPEDGAAVSAPKDPFNPPIADLQVQDERKDTVANTRSAVELAGLLIAQIQPTGSMMLGGEPYLLFTERRQKIGDKIAVSLEGVEYTVEIVNIANNRFRIRYQDREAERTIK